MTPKTEEIINAMNYLDEFEEKYLQPIVKEYETLKTHSQVLTEKQELRFSKLAEQEQFLSGMVKNFRCLIELSVSDELDKENFLKQADEVMLIKEGNVRSNLIPKQVEFLTNYYNKLKNETNEKP